jgi:polyhydroxybutyrate depolymerase
MIMIFRALAVAVLVACGASTPQSPPRTFGGDRPVELQVPDVLQSRRKFPLIVVLHDYGSTGADQNAYFGITTDGGSEVVFVLAPDGTTDKAGKQFWNADPTCCDIDHTNPDDVGYLAKLIEQVGAAWPIDPSAVAVVGYANGGTMAYRLACERADVVSNIVVLASQPTSTACAPTRGVNVLEIHGTADDVVPYSVAGPSVQQWAVNDHCGTIGPPGTSLDLDSVLAGNETLTQSVTGCPPGITVDLWTIEGGGHHPTPVTTFGPTVRQWVISHPRS